MVNKVTILLIALVNVSCTSMLWEENSYTEYVGGFYIEESSNTLVAIGSEFHYLFNVNSNLIEILKSSESISYKPAFRAFRVSKDNKVLGRLILEVNKEGLSHADISFLKSHNFNQASNSRLSFHQAIKGDRYAIDKEFKKLVNFERAYKVDVVATLPDEGYAQKMILSPVTILSDAILLIPMGVLYGVLFAFD